VLPGGRGGLRQVHGPLLAAPGGPARRLARGRRRAARAGRGLRSRGPHPRAGGSPRRRARRRDRSLRAVRRGVPHPPPRGRRAIGRSGGAAVRRRRLRRVGRVPGRALHAGPRRRPGRDGPRDAAGGLGRCDRLGPRRQPGADVARVGGHDRGPAGSSRGGAPAGRVARGPGSDPRCCRPGGRRGERAVRHRHASLLRRVVGALPPRRRADRRGAGRPRRRRPRAPRRRRPRAAGRRTVRRHRRGVRRARPRL
ncbi:MAG: SAM-dependent methyltransferase, partial [uncultured Nocardioides sp.]